MLFGENQETDFLFQDLGKTLHFNLTNRISNFQSRISVFNKRQDLINDSKVSVLG